MTKKKIVKLAVIRSNGEDACPFGLPIPFGCRQAGKLISRMAPLDILGEDAEEEEKAEIASANQRLLMWMLSEEAGGRCPFAGKLFKDKDTVECNWDTNVSGPEGPALKGSPFYYRHFSGIGLDGLYSYPLGYYTDNSIDRGMYYGMYSIESPGSEEFDLIKTAEQLSVFTFVPIDALDSIKKYGLLSAAKLINTPAALKAAFPTEADRKKKIESTNTKLEDPEWKDFVHGISAFFTLPDWSSLPDKHFIFKDNLVPIEIKLSEFIKDNPKTKLIGVELEKFNSKLKEQPDRERNLSLKEVKDFAKISPAKLWKNYQKQTDMYAPDVPHLIIIADKIPTKYLFL